MPRYFFDIRDHKGLHHDDDGVECDDLDDARKQAQTLVADVIREQVPDGDLHEVACEVREGTRKIAYRVKVTLQGAMSPARDELMPSVDEPTL